MSNEEKKVAEENVAKTAVFSNEYESNGNYKVYEVTTMFVEEADRVRITDVSPFHYPPPIGEIPHVGPVVKPVATWFPDALLSELCCEGLIDEVIPEGDTSLKFLETLCERGLTERYTNILPFHRERLSYEIDIISKKDFIWGFLIIWDFVRFARSKNLIISLGNGSIPGSLVAFCLGITGVDPLGEDLLFERYLNMERETHFYGIRIDIEKGAKDLIFDYLSDKYGKGMPKFLEMMDIHIKEKVELSIIKETIEKISKSKGISIDLSTVNKNDPDIYKSLCSGTSEGIFYFDKADPHTYTTGGWQDDDKEWHEFHPPIVIEDEGLFRAILPKTMNELMAFICLDRHLPEDVVERYLNNKNNPNDITYECPDLEPILDSTYGCLVYQEQVMWILQVIGGFTPGQSDSCRRALSKKQRSVTDEMRKQFIEAAMSTAPGYFTNRIDEDVASAIYDKLCSDAPYCFNKAHAVTEAMMIYDMAWLKYYYEPEFLEAVEKYKGVRSDILP